MLFQRGLRLQISSTNKALNSWVHPPENTGLKNWDIVGLRLIFLIRSNINEFDRSGECLCCVWFWVLLIYFSVAEPKLF